jgi:hypothetical protein
MGLAIAASDSQESGRQVGDKSPVLSLRFRVVSRATGLHHPLDRLGLLLYISPKRLSVQRLAQHHLAGTDTQTDLARSTAIRFITSLPLIIHRSSRHRTVVRGESITDSNRSLRALGPAVPAL